MDFYGIVAVVGPIKLQVRDISTIHVLREAAAVDSSRIHPREIEKAIPVIMKRKKVCGAAVRSLGDPSSFQEKRAALRYFLQISKFRQIDSRGVYIGPIESNGHNNCKYKYSEDTDCHPSIALYTGHLLCFTAEVYPNYASRTIPISDL